MDVFAGISLEGFKILTWVTAVVIGLLCFFLTKSEGRYWQIVQATSIGLLAAATVFLLTNLGVVFYILAHLTDPRWSAGKEPLWRPNELNQDVPFIGGLIETLNGLQENVSGAVNDVGMMKNAAFATIDFLWMSLWAIGAVIVLAVCALIAYWWARKQAAKEQVRVVHSLRTELNAVHAENNVLRANVADIRQQIRLPPFQNPGA